MDALNLGCNITEPIEDLSLEIVYYFKYGMIYRKFLVDFTVNICSIFDGKISETQDLLTLSFIQSLVNSDQNVLIHPCPYLGPHYLRNFTANDLLGQFLLPEGDYRAENRFFVAKNNRTILHYRIYYNVKAKRLFEK